MLANDTQVGGTHYSSKFQHWDFVESVGLPYLPAQVTKYISRWRKKGGVQDLQKALHFLDKFIEEELKRQLAAREQLQTFSKENEIHGEEHVVFLMLVKYQLGETDRLAVARAQLQKMLETEENTRKEQAAKAAAEIDAMFSTKENLTDNGGPR